MAVVIKSKPCIISVQGLWLAILRWCGLEYIEPLNFYGEWCLVQEGKRATNANHKSNMHMTFAIRSSLSTTDP